MTGAPGPRDFTVRVIAVRLRHLRVHRIPASRVVTIAIRPSSQRGGMRALLRRIRNSVNRNILRWRLDRRCRSSPDGQSNCSTAVVPAKARTHNPREKFLRRSSATAAYGYIPRYGSRPSPGTTWGSRPLYNRSRRDANSCPASAGKSITCGWHAHRSRPGESRGPTTTGAVVWLVLTTSSLAKRRVTGALPPFHTPTRPTIPHPIFARSAVREPRP